MYLENFRETITEYCQVHNISINEFSQKVNIANSTITRWMNANFCPNIKAIFILADYMNISIDYMFGLSYEKKYFQKLNNENFAINLKNLLNKKKLSPYKLAKDCKFQKAAVSKWINNQRLPRINNLIEIALYFDCSIDFLLS